MKKVMYFYLFLAALITVSNEVKAATVKDIDGNIYHTVTIGNQTWLVENLKTTKYRNGDVIPNVTDSIEWGKLTTGAQCTYNNDELNASKFGRLYNWYAVNGARGITPTGWHVASYGDWQLLEDYLIANGYNFDEKNIGKNYAKSLAATTDWSSWSKPGRGESAIGNDLSKNNSTGFTALPGGWRAKGKFSLLNTFGFWWTSTEFNSKAWCSCLMNVSSSNTLNQTNKSTGYSVRCVKDSKPTITTLSVVISSDSTATIDSRIITDGGCPIKASGICWSSSSNPTIKLTTKTVTPDKKGTLGLFRSTMNRLENNKTYHVRTYAIYNDGKSDDVVYGNEQKFTFNSETLPIKDIDGNVYHTVKIGKQVWMVENLKTTKYRDGSPISNIPDSAIWKKLNEGARCAYKNQVDYIAKYGQFYNWYAVNDPRKLAPVGWHIPTDEEWETLTEYLGGEKVAGGMLKEANTSSWESPNIEATNESGFNAIPGGYRTNNGVSGFCGEWGFWWSATERSNLPFACSRFIVTNNSGIGKQFYPKSYGFSLRCVKD